MTRPTDAEMALIDDIWRDRGFGDEELRLLHELYATAAELDDRMRPKRPSLRLFVSFTSGPADLLWGDDAAT